MVCKYCGGEIPRGANICPYCTREADPRERVVQRVYVTRPYYPNPDPRQQKLQADFHNLVTRSFLLALFSLVLFFVRIVLLPIAAVCYSQANQFARLHRLPVPPLLNTSRILLVIALVLAAVEIVLVIAFLDITSKG